MEIIGLEGDSVRLRVEYSVNGVDWNRASIVGDTLIGSVGDRGVVLWHSYNDLPDTFGIVYFGVIWLSDSDFPNQDVWGYIKITPFDRDTGRNPISGRFKVDNQTGPIILSSNPINVSFYNDTIKLRFEGCKHRG